MSELSEPQVEVSENQRALTGLARLKAQAATDILDRTWPNDAWCPRLVKDAISLLQDASDTLLELEEENYNA